MSLVDLIWPSQESSCAPPWQALYHPRGMKKEQIARQLAKESRVSTVVAADQVDRVVSDLLMRLRKGESASLPGLGTFQPGSQKEFQFETDRARKSSQAAPLTKEHK
jgi:nucleoid DNA-binding protein